jgi:hypothetical protein
MIDIIKEKVIISGKEIEHYQYLDKAVLRGYRRKKRKNPIKDNEPKEQTEKSKSSVIRTRTEIRRIVNANPQLEKFLTLTFDDNTTEIKKANPKFNIFIQKMKDKFPEFQYLSVPEFQKDIDFHGKVKPDGGAVHYHMLCNLRYVPVIEINKIWKNGGVDIKRIDRVRNVGAYICKYLHKDMFDKRMFHKKKYFCSQDLERPAEIINDNANFFMKDSEANFKFIKESKFHHEYTGDVLYRLYNFKNYQP